MTMKPSELSERLLKELKRNKAKSAALGVLCLVAIYFWLPLITKYFKKNNQVQSAPQSVATKAVVHVQPVKPIENTPEFVWKEFLAWMADEPRMTVLAVSPDTRNPFARSAKAPVVASGESSQPAEQESEIGELPLKKTIKGPSDYGMVLRGTLVGGRRSTANIDGTNYGVGAFVPIADSAGASVQDQGSEGFRLLEVKPRYVTLERRGQLFRLELQRPGSEDHNLIIRPVGQ